jgi:quercetin 2,3-dioxygenase
MSQDIIKNILPLGFPWRTMDPFLFCVHHLDLYPKGKKNMGPDASLEGRNIGMDFQNKDGWNMYHGEVVPGFPRHPHRGFETVTIARQGFIDHSDSLGATARFGQGDTQWMTAGKGVVHSEMFPLINQDKENPTELFQIWLNLPGESKMVDPYFTMLWHEAIPQVKFTNEAGKTTQVAVIAGSLGEVSPPNPPPNSWAAAEGSNVAIWTIKMEPEASWTLPLTSPETHRTLYFFKGARLRIGKEEIREKAGIVVRSDKEVELTNGEAETEILVLQGKPIGEPVAQHGPFVMNTPGEIKQAISDFHRTGFGGWPWKEDAPVHPREQGRFAIHADQRKEEP